MDLLIIVLLVVLIVLTAWLLSKQKSNVPDSSAIINEIIAKLSQNNTQNLAQLLGEVNKSAQTQETRFNQLQVKLLEETSVIKDQNQRSLLSILAQVRDQLAKSIGELNQRNKENFDLLNTANKEKLYQLELEISKRLDENLAQNLKSFENVTKNLTQMEAKAQQMIESTRSVDKLNSIFERTSAKAFGSFGENYLESLLRDNLAVGSWQKQAKVPGSSEIIDFIITIDSYKIGIDCKFPLTRFQDYIDAGADNKKTMLKTFLQSVLLMAKDIHEKYSKVGFADILMIYFPSDSMYNEVVGNTQVMETLHKLKVQPTSPSTVFPLIMLIQTYQFRGHINENAELIVNGLKTVRKNIDSFRDEFRKLGDKLRQAQQNYDIADRNLIGVQNEVLKLESTHPSLEVEKEESRVLI